MCWQNGGVKELRCLKIESSRAHTKPITVLEAEGERVITGSEDRTLKVRYNFMFFIQNLI